MPFPQPTYQVCPLLFPPAVSRTRPRSGSRALREDWIQRGGGRYHQAVSITREGDAGQAGSGLFQLLT